MANWAARALKVGAGNESFRGNYRKSAYFVAEFTAIVGWGRESKEIWRKSLSADVVDDVDRTRWRTGTDNGRRIAAERRLSPRFNVPQTGPVKTAQARVTN